MITHAPVALKNEGCGAAKRDLPRGIRGELGSGRERILSQLTHTKSGRWRGGALPP